MASQAGALRLALAPWLSQPPLQDVSLLLLLVRIMLPSLLHLPDCSVTAYSGRYRSSLSTAQPTSSRIVARAPADCIEPDSFGFIDENGKEHVSKISAGNRRAIYAALGKGDVATLKVEAATDRKSVV